MERVLSLEKFLRLTRLIVLVSFCLAIWCEEAWAVDDNLNIVFTTTDAGGSYGDRHVHVAWVTDTSNNFVYTAGTNVGIQRTVWANARKYSLATWWSTNPNGQADIDARTGATQSVYRTYDLNWNFRRKDGSEVPDGTYRLYFECTNSDTGFPRNFTYFTITKGGAAWSQGPSSQGGYNNVTLTYTPGVTTAPVVENLETTEIGYHSARLNGQVTDTGGEDPNVVIYWGDDDGGTGIWDHAVLLGTKTTESFYTYISGLNPDTAYYFRCYAENSSGGAWADSTGSFATLQPSPSIQLDPNELSFPLVDVGDYNDLTFDIRNTGSDASLQVESVAIVGLDQAVYSLVSPPTVPFIIPPLGSQSIAVRFTPLGAQSYSNTAVAVAGDDPNAPVSLLALHGQGGPAAGAITNIAGSVGGDSHAIALHNHYAFVAQGAALTILDKSNPSDLQEVSRARLDDVIHDVEVAGSVAYAAAGALGLVPVEITDVCSPQVLAAHDTPGHAYDVASSGSTLCVADGPGGLRVFDISVANEPNLQGVYNTQGSARAVALRGTTAYVLDDQLGLQVIDVSNPANPSLLGSCNEIEFGRAVAVNDLLACCITDSFGNFFVVDVSVPTAPYIFGQLRLAGGEGQSIVMSSFYAYVAIAEQGIEIIEWFTPASLGVCDTPGRASGVAISGSVAYVADGPAGLRAIDVSNPPAASEQGAYELQASGHAVGAEGPSAYVAKSEGGIQAIDISSPSSPNQLSALDSLLEGDIYLDQGVDFFDLSLLAQDWLQSGPALTGDVYRDGTVDEIDVARLVGNWLVDGLGGEIADIGIWGQVAYIANGLSGLQILDISDPAAPVRLGSFPTQGYAASVAVAASLALVADGTNVYVLDVSDNRWPLLADLWTPQGWAFGVATDGSHGYVADGGWGIAILDLTDPSNVAPAGSYQTPGVAYAVAVANDRAYVADGPAGLQIIDVSNPADPLPVSSFDTPGTAVNVAVANSKAYVTDEQFGLSVIDVSVPLAPSLHARTTVPQAIVADDMGGLVILGGL
ncbi:MAG: hypothetical protein ACYTEL_22870 [Planctomycetota bacterium]|jgi:hypothetical protein